MILADEPVSSVDPALAAAIAFPLALLTTRTSLYRGVPYVGQRPGPVRGALRRGAWVASKAVLAVLRTPPEIVRALVFVSVVGLGPFAGVLALGVHTGGVLGTLFGEALEDPVGSGSASTWRRASSTTASC